MTKRTREHQPDAVDVREPIHNEALQYLYKIKDLCSWHSTCRLYMREWREFPYLCQLLKRSRLSIALMYDLYRHKDYYDLYDSVNQMIYVMERMDKVFYHFPAACLPNLHTCTHFAIGDGTLAEIFGDEPIGATIVLDNFSPEWSMIVKKISIYVKSRYGWSMYIHTPSNNLIDLSCDITIPIPKNGTLWYKR